MLVGIAVPLKHVFGDSVGVRVLGPLHGLAFLGYVVCVLERHHALSLSTDLRA